MNNPLKSALQAHKKRRSRKLLLHHLKELNEKISIAAQSDKKLALTTYQARKQALLDTADNFIGDEIDIIAIFHEADKVTKRNLPPE